ncbi:hypothetical protein HHI36_019488 [Cryptolaemus montrouzieri]|uniref:Uncharacterized protein n=1 Tax=Cryptolaemus montrouzieri TaxID=559131 RepID=A0ABD2P380_9CUCU
MNQIVSPSSSVTPIMLTNNLSTSISIIDIENIQDINGTGCQMNIEDVHKKHNIKIFSNKANNRQSVNPRNTRVFQSRRVQVCPYFFMNRNHKHKHPIEMRTVQLNENKKEHTSCAKREVDYNNNQSYPDVNIHLISMVLPHLKKSLIVSKTGEFPTNKKKFLIPQTTIGDGTQNNSKLSKNSHKTKSQKFGNSQKKSSKHVVQDKMETKSSHISNKIKEIRLADSKIISSKNLKTKNNPTKRIKEIDMMKNKCKHQNKNSYRYDHPKQRLQIISQIYQHFLKKLIYY